MMMMMMMRRKERYMITGWRSIEDSSPVEISFRLFASRKRSRQSFRPDSIDCVILVLTTTNNYKQYLKNNKT